MWEVEMSESSKRSSELWEAFLGIRHLLIVEWVASGMDVPDIFAALSMDYEQVRGIAMYDGLVPGEVDRRIAWLERELAIAKGQLS